MTKEEKNNFLIKMTILSNQMLYEMDNANVNSPESEQLKKLLEKHTQYAYGVELLKSTSFIQTLENKFDTIVRKTLKEFNIKL